MTQYSKILEQVCLLTGIILLVLTGLVRFAGIAYSRSAVADFEHAQNLVVTPAEQLNWSEGRKAEYEQAASKDTGTTLAILRTPSTGMVVPVFDSLSNTALNRGAGHVSGTALPGGDGNIAIAGHRDGFFRSLKDVEVGAEIEVTTHRGSRSFLVFELLIVDPLDVSVLDPTVTGHHGRILYGNLSHGAGRGRLSGLRIGDADLIFEAAVRMPARHARR